MKRLPFRFACICAVCILAACAHPPRTTANKPMNESLPPSAAAPSVPASPEKTRMEQALEMVRQGEAEPYVSARKDDIVVRADIAIEDSRFMVVYDIASLDVDPRGSVLRIPFSIEGRETHEIRTGVFEHESASDAGILLAFDDDYHESWERSFGLFDKFGARATFFVQGRPLAFCKAALERGHDVGYHTINHLNLSNVSRARFLEECTAQIGIFRRVGIPLNSFAYPFGLYEPWMSDVLLDYFKILRGYGVTFHIYDASAVRGFIASKAVDNTLYRNDGEFKALVLLMLRTVKFMGGVLPLTTHDVSAHADWGIKPERLEFLLKTAADLKLKFYVYSDFLE